MNTLPSLPAQYLSLAATHRIAHALRSGAARFPTGIEGVMRPADNACRVNSIAAAIPRLLRRHRKPFASVHLRAFSVAPVRPYVHGTRRGARV